jgi:plasmid stabilization system protein ParE
VTVVQWTDQAVEDLCAIRLLIERDSPRYGRLVAERLYEATSQIGLFPYSRLMVPELGREDIRELIVGDVSRRSSSVHSARRARFRTGGLAD